MGCIFALIISIAAIVTAFLFQGYYLFLLLVPFMAAPLSIMWMIFRHRIGKSFRRWFYARMGWGRTIEELSQRLHVDVSFLRNFTPAYREKEIPKRSGGIRKLQIPDAETKVLQRKILHLLLRKLPAHDAAHAFELGRSIVSQAAIHVGKAIVIKIDIVNFFPATTADRIKSYFRQIGWNREAAAVLTRLTTVSGGLPQGAPTSPRIANLVNFPLDRNLTAMVNRFRGAYTRYADDITISFPGDWPRQMRGIVTYVRKTCKAAGYKIHGKPKFGIFRAHQRQVACGLVLNKRINLPREKRRWLRAVAHRLKRGEKASLTTEQLHGWIAYLRMIEQGEASRLEIARKSAGNP